MAGIFDLFDQISKAKKEPQGQPTHLVVGLGNPGKPYEITRHNSGFMFVEFLEAKYNFSADRARSGSLYGFASIAGKRVVVACPQTFMNNSGVAVRDLAAYFNIPTENIIVVCDDINLEVGKMRIRRKGSAGGQKGMESIIYQLESEDFPRIKIGIGKKPHPSYDLADWVLSKFTKEELATLGELFENTAAALELMLEGKTEQAMNKYN